MNLQRGDTRREAQCDHESARREAHSDAAEMRREFQGECDHDTLVRIETSLADLVKLVKGNGQPGLLQRISGLELWRSMLVGGWVLAAAILAVYTALKK